MALSKRLFYRKPPDHLLEIAERVYVFDCCFSTDILDEDEHMDGVVVQLLEHFPDVSIMVFNFGEGDKSSQLYNICTHHKVTVTDYPLQYDNCALLPLEMINQFLQSCDTWLSANGEQNVLLMHCEKGGWPLLAFMLAALLLYRKQFTGEQKILEMMYKQASKELLFLFPVNSQPSQLRYLHYISWKALSDTWPMPATLVRIDSIILRFLPVLKGGNVCKPDVRVYGKDPSVPDIGNSKLLLSTAKDKMRPQHYAQADCNLVKIDIHCSVQGDVVIECVHLDDNQNHEMMMFRAMFHTSYLRSNLLVLGRDEIDILWEAKDKFPNDFKAEVLFLDADSFVHVQPTEMTREGCKNGTASHEEFSKVDGQITMFKGRSGIKDSDSTEAEGSGKEVWTEEVAPHIFQASTSEDVNQRLDSKVHISGPHVVEVKGVDILNAKQDEEKGITVDQWDIEADPSSTIVDMISDKKSKEVVKETSEKSEVTRNTLRINLGNIAAKLKLKVQEQKESSEVVGRKTDKILTPKLKKPPTFFTKAVVVTAGGKQKGKQQEPSVNLAKSPTKEKPTVSRWIPSNKGSYTNSMHVAYPPKRTISVPPSLAVTVPKKTNFLRKGGGAKKSASHTDLTRVRVRKGSLNSPTVRFIRTPSSPLPQDEPTRMAVKACRALMLMPSTPRSPLVSTSSASRLGVPPLWSRETSPSTEDTQDSCSPRLPLLKLPPPKPRPSSTSLQLTQSSSCASSPPPSSPPTLFHDGAAKQEKLIKSLPSPSSTSPSPLDEERVSGQVSSPPKPPVAPLSNDPSILPTTFATTLERNNFRVSKATPAPPLHAMPPDCPTTLAADLLIQKMAPLSMAPHLEKSLTSGVPAQSTTPSIVALPPTLSDAPPGPSHPLSMSGVPPPPPPPSVMGASGPLHLSACRMRSPVKSGVPLPSPLPINAECLSISPLSNAVPPPPPVPMSRVPPPPLHPMLRVQPVNGGHQPSLTTMSGVPPPPPHSMNRVPPPPPRPMTGVQLPQPPPMSGVQPLTSPLVNGGPPPPPYLTSVGVPPPPPALHGAAPPPPMSVKGPGFGGLSFGRGSSTSRSISVNKSLLKPLHWSKVTRALKGSLWEELQRNGETHIAHEFDVSEIETLFSAVTQKTDKGGDKRKSAAPKTDKVTLIDLRRANNTEIMLSKVKMPLPDIMMAVLALDDSVLDIDQVENLIKFCPTKEEMDLLKAYAGDREKLGKCEQYFLELMKVPRVESKLRVFAFKIQFGSQTSDFRQCLNTVNAACEEVRNSYKLKEIMKRILFLGNTLNNGTARGSAVGFKLESLLKLYDTRSSNSKMTLMHYLCKVIASKSPTLIDFYNDLGNLEAASKIQLKSLAEEMQAISKGLEKVKVELGASENDGPVSDTFRKTLTGFVGSAEKEVASVTELFSAVGPNANALALYFGEDPALYPFEQVCATIVNFVRLFQKAHEENLKEAEQEKKKLEREAEAEKSKETNLSASGKN